MFGRPLFKIGVFLAAIVVPYLALDEKLRDTVRTQLSRLTSSSSNAPADPLAKVDELLKTAAAPAATPAATSVAAASSPVAPLTVPLVDAIRFDVTPQWVTSRWTTVSSVIGDSDHLGLRVMLVSGTSPGDVAGSLTYYFTQQHQVERITLHGVTGEPSQLADLVVGKFGLRPTQTKDLGLYYGGDLNVPTSSLKLTTLPVIRPEAPLARVQVALDLKRSDVSRIKPEAEESPRILPSSYRRW
jgi:hypothetical protein